MSSILDIYNNLFHPPEKKNDILPPVIIDRKPKPRISITDWTTLKPINVNLINPIDFPTDKFYPLEYTKSIITIHHTVSGPGIRGDIDHWLSLKDRIATCVIIDDKGIANQCFSSKYWAHHLGVKSTFLKQKGFTDWTTRNVELNRTSIAIEIDNWGGLILGDGKIHQFGIKKNGTPNNKSTAVGKYYAAYGNKVNCDIQEYPDGFRGYKYYQKYSEAQIKTVGELLLLWNIKYKIPLNYHKDMWDISKDALSGEPGVWSHVSVRPDKSDCHPQPELIEMLQTLESLT